MAEQNSIKSINMGYIDLATINNTTFTAVTNALVPEACFTLSLVNDSNLSFQVSYDGVNAHEVMIANSQFQIGSSLIGDHARFPKGTIIAIKGTPGVGYFYFGGYYL